MLDFSISVRRGWADSSEIALLTAMVTSQKTKRVVAEGVSKFDSVLFLVFFRNAKFFTPNPGSKTSNLRKPTLPLESPGIAGLHGDNLVAWLVSCLTFFNKGISWQKSMEDGLMIKHSMFFICLDGRSVGKQKPFCLRMWFRSLFWSETTSLVLFYPKCIQL